MVGKDADKQLTVAQFARGSTYSHPGLRLLLVEWVSSCHRPFSIVEDKPFRKICEMLHGGVKLVSRQTLTEDMKDVLEATREHVRKLLKRVKCRFHMALDGWTSPNVISTLGIVLIFFDDELKKTRVITLDLMEYVLSAPCLLLTEYLYRLKGSHTGEYLANRIFECLEFFGISKQVSPVFVFSLYLALLWGVAPSSSNGQCLK